MIRFAILLIGFLVAATIAFSQESEEPREGGLTGTGIVAMLNAGGSIDINGLSFELPELAEVESPMGLVPLEDLQPGDMIALEFAGNRPDAVAVSARKLIQIIAPISEVTNDGYVLLGTTVTDPFGPSAKEGEWIAASGYWREDGLVASRIQVVPPQAAVHLHGTFVPVSTGIGQVGGTLLAGDLPEALGQGEIVSVWGQVGENSVRIDTVEVGHFATQPRVVLSQGYLSVPDATGRYTILGTGISSVTTQPQMINQREFVTACGIDGALHFEEDEIQDAEIRNSLLTFGCITE